ncbi:MAG: BA14K family protein [Nitratireductor sp.]
MSPNMNSRFAAGALAAVIAVGVLAPTQAHADHRYRHHHNGDGDAFVAGVAGVILGSVLAAPRYPVYVAPPPPPVVYVEPQPVYVEPQPVYSDPGYLSAPATPYPVYQPVYPNERARRPLSQVRRDQSGPKVITYEETVRNSRNAGGYGEPWTASWENWCSAKYRTFDASTGTYNGYDGKRHFCVVQ